MESSKPQFSSSPKSEECFTVAQELNSIEPNASASSVPTPFVFCDPSVSANGTVNASGTADPIEMAGFSTISPNFSSSDEESPITDSDRKKTYYTSEEFRNLWSWKRIYRRLLTAEQCIEFAEEKGLIPTAKTCHHHKRPMTLNMKSGQVGVFRCRKSACRHKSYSRANGTWFEQAKLPLPVVFQLMFAFSDQQTYYQIQREVAEGDDPGLSTVTIADWYKYCRETIVIYELYHQEAEEKIGGPGKIVQIYESKIGKRKYNKGSYIEGQWAIGLIDQNNDMRFEMLPDNERTVEVMVPLIQKHVEVGSIIHVSTPAAYSTLSDYGYITTDESHIQRIKSQWRGLSNVFRLKKKRGNFTDMLIEYSWRRKIRIRHRDPFEELIKAIKYVYPCT